jgi:hypothetical protein
VDRKLHVIEELLNLEDDELDRLYEIVREPQDIAPIEDALDSLEIFYRMYHKSKFNSQDLADNCKAYFKEIVHAINLIDEYIGSIEKGDFNAE